MAERHLKVGETVRFGAVTHDPSGGQIKNADETPKWFVYEDGSDSVLLEDSFILRTNLIGTYRGNFDASGVLGFEAGKYYEVHASGKVNGVVGRDIVSSFVLDDIFDANIVNVTGHPVIEAGSVDVNLVEITGVAFTEDSYFKFHAPPTGIADAVWDEKISEHLTNGSFGSGINELLTNIYYADIKFLKDGTNIQDEYGVQWFKNGLIVVSGSITNPAMSVYNVQNGNALLSNQKLTFSSVNLGSLFHTEGGSLTTSGVPYLVCVSGLIDNSNRTWKEVVGIDIL